MSRKRQINEIHKKKTVWVNQNTLDLKEHGHYVTWKITT